jgi:fibronectin-binding autotransporter adhesin
VKSDRSGVAYGAHLYVLNAAGNQDENHYNRTEGRLNHAQIGHGGDNVYGDKTGAIDVTAGAGINVRGGDRVTGSLDNNAGYLNYAQIGHGGYASWRQIRSNLALPGLTSNADEWGIPFWHNGTTYVFDGTGQFPWPVDNSINAALGLGNQLNDGFSGNVSVTATSGNINFQGGTSVGTFAQVGHGGIETGGDHGGDLTVAANGGDITFSANRIEETGSNSTGSYSYVQVGHGGAFSSGDAEGDIDVTASGKIRFKAGRTDSYATVGHGGRESHGTTTNQWGTTNPIYRKSSNFLYSQNSMYRPGTRTGDIGVTAGGDIEFIGGNLNGDRAFTQVGHGGFNIHADPASAKGDGHSGDIDVVSSGGSILLRGGDRANSHALIGHGGTESFGNHGGDGTDARADSDIVVQAKTGINVMATGRFDSNNVARNFAQIGHGGWRSSNRDIEDIDGNRYAKLQPYGANYTNPITLTTNVDNTGLHPLTPSTTDVEGIGWRGADPWGVRATLGTFKGDITVRTTDAGADIRFIAPDAAEGTLGIRGEDSYVQLGHGGWRNFANLEGNITVESGGDLEFRAIQGAAPAPNNSNHNVAYAQLGHGGFESGGQFTGNINVTTGGDIVFRGGDSINGANGGYAQMGHGGYNTYRGTAQYREALRDPITGVAPAEIMQAGNTGNILVNSGGDISFLAGRDFATYAQIGHGGYISKDSNTGNIDITATGGIRFIASIDDVGGAGDNAGNNNDSWAQLGHGGVESDGSHKGNITVRAGEFAAGPQIGYGLYFKGGNWDENFAQLGHGGYGSRSYGNGVNAVGFQGNIDVEVNGDITFVAGTYANPALFTNEDGRNYVQLGHGGVEADTSQDNAIITGLVDAFGNPIGHSGDIRVVAKDGSINFLAGDSARTFEPSAGTGRGNNHYAQLGHGGVSSHGNHYGDITVQAGISSNLVLGSKGDGDILFASGGGSDNEWADVATYAQLGHGGRGTYGNFGLRDVGGNPLNTISVMAGRDITFTAADASPSAYALLGLGGYDSRGDHFSNIQVFAERNVRFVGGNRYSGTPAAGTGRVVKYGHDARTDTNNLTINQDRAANLNDGSDVNLLYARVVPGSVSVAIRLDNGTIVGSLSDADGNGTLTADGNITADFQDGLGTRTITAGTHVGNVVYAGEGTSTITFLQDVNPGQTASPNAQNTEVGDAGTVNLWITLAHGDQTRAFAQLGNGGYDSDNPNDTDLINGNKGSIFVTARTGSVSLLGGRDDDSYAHIGHGGRSTKGANTGDIFVRAAGGVDLIAGPNRDREYVQIGHGGWDADGAHSGKIIVSAGSGDLFTSLGTGRFNDVGDFNGDATPDTIQFLGGGTGVVNVLGGNWTDNWAMIGHGGRSAVGNHSGHIGVSATGDINLLAGSGARGFSQIGHGGWDDNGVSSNLSGSIHVITEGGNLRLKAGAGDESYALIGHGNDQNNNADNAGGTRLGRIQAIANHITLDRNTNRAAWIGHSFDMSSNVDDPFADQALQVPGDNLGGGYEVIGRSGLSYLNNGALQNSGTITITDNFRDRFITPNLKDANFAFSGGNLVINTIIDATTSYALPATHAKSVTFLAAGDIDVNRRIAGPGTGSINLVAGAGLASASIVDDPSRTGGASGTNLNYQSIDHLWNGNVPTGYIDFSKVRSDGLQFGNANGFAITSAEFDNAGGEISIDAINNGGNFNLGVGSKTGETNALGYGVRLVGGESASEYAQLGFNTDVAGDPASGSVWVSAKNDGVLVQSGTGAGTSAQIGHGGVGGNANVKNFSGSIAVRADYGSIPGNVSVLSGTGDSGHSQIGHGGRQNDGSHSGDITVIGQGITVTSGASAAQIGHGGFSGTGNYAGNLYLNYDSITAAAAGGGGALSITAGNGFDDYAQIGHGGVVASGGTRSGDIIVGQSASVSIQGGTNRSAYAQLGHGGVFPGAGALSGNINVTTAGNVSVLAGNSGSGGTNGLAFAQLGHGGASATGTKTGDITLNALGTQVSVAGGSAAFGATGNFGLIGHGGDLATGGATGNLVINAPNAGLSLTGGNQTRAFAKVGHGGYSSGGIQSGSIDIDLGGAVSLSGGADQSFSQIGHGGPLSTGSRDGAISVISTNGDLSMVSGAGLNAYTQIGHGGVGVTGNHGSSLANGAIKVGIAGNILLNAGGGTDAYTQIGQGGVGAVGTHLGDICVTADGTVVFNNGLQGAGTRAYGQIGHGGFNAAGNHSGEITVVSGYVDAGGITMNGGSGTDQYVQIGHGGTNATGNLSGRVYVVADKGGDLVMRGGSAAGTYAMISHGDGHGAYGSFGTGTTGGTRQGGIQYFVDGDAILNAGTGANSNVHLIHRTNDSGGLNGTNYLGGDGYQYVVNGTSSSTNGTDHNNARENEGTIIAGNFGTGNIVITNTGNLTLNNPLVPTGEFVNHSFSFIVMATGNLNFERSFQNAGTGLVALVAGWDGMQDLSTINYNNGPCDPEIIPGSIDFNDCDRFGNNNGILTIGSSTQAGPFAVGSRQGQTILRGYGINVVGSNATAGGSTQIGFRADGSGDITGTIDVQAKQGGLTLQGGTADNAFVQIGHGTGSGTFANNVTSSATVDISFCEPGTVTLNGGGNGAFAMIGNGGGTGNYTRNGNVTITDFAGVSLAGGTGTGAFTQIGSGGLGGQGVINSVVTLNGQGNIGVSGGSGGNAFAHIGAGGLNHTGAITGATSVETTGGNLTMSGGSGAGSFAQLGAGGLNTDGAISGAVTATIDGSIQLTGGSNGDSYVQIGVGGSGSDGVKSGDVTVSGTSATLTGGTGAGSSVLIGNGGGATQSADNASGSITGNVSVTATAGAVSMSAAGAAADNFAQIGAGGRGSVGAGNTINSTTSVITTGGGLTMNAANAAYVQIGAGGHQVDVTSLSGDVTVNAGGAISISGGAGQNRYAQIGNGGMGSFATKTGNTTVSGSSLLMTTGSGAGANVLIGLGGGMDQTNSNFATGALTGNVLVTTTTDGVTLNSASAGVQAFAQIGNGGLVSDGNLSGTTTVNSAGAVALTAGTQSNTYARIGAGGSGNDGTISNAATTVTGTNLSMNSGSNSSAYTQIGAGGGATGGGNLALGNVTGDVSVTMTGTITMNAGTGGSAFSQIGAGGAGFNGTSPLNTITSVTNVSGTSLAMNSGSGSGAYAQIGAGGGTTGVGTATPSQGSITGNVTVGTTAGGISMGGINSGTRSYVQIGAGGSGIESGAVSLGAANTITSNTTVTTVGGDLTMNSSLSSYNQIGAGGLNSDGTLNGAVNVTVGGALTLTGGVNSTRRFAQIGNGGIQSDGAKSGLINVSATSIGLNAGTTERSYAQIGHGGADASGAVTSANLTVNSIGAISLTSGGNQAYTQIGHGGFNATTLSVSNAAIAINTAVGTGTGDITLTGGSGTNASAIIGHGGARTDTTLTNDMNASGDVTISRAANVRVNAGSNTDSFAQIGHAGERATATFSGNIAVTSSGLVQVQGGASGTGAYGQIGHGGRIHNGVKSGSITVSAVGPLSLLGGGGIGSSAQIGHGGGSSSGNLTGDIALNVGGNVSLLGGSLDEAYAQVGHGGHLATGTFGGNVGLNYNFGTNQVTGAAGSITMTGGSGLAKDAYAQFGHGGSGNNIGISAKSGNVVVGGVTSATLSGGTSTGGDNFVQIGHGGDENDGDATGSVALLSSGPVTMNGGSAGSDGYVQVGLGGHEATGNFGMVGDIVSVIGLGIDLNGGSGTRSSVQVGSGGYNADGALTGSVFVNFNPLTNLPVGGGAITVNAGSGTESFAQIGLGGSAQDGGKNGNTTIQGASLEVVAGSGAAAYAQIGSGSGIRSDLTDFGSGLINTTTSVTATSGGVTVSAAGAGAHSFAQIGGGGLIADGALSRNTGMSTVVNASGDIVLTGGGNSNTYAMIGLGGSGGDGVKSLAGTSVTGASVTMTGGSGASAFTQIGSGGGMTGGNNVSTGAVTGDTTLTTTVGGITATSGTGGNAYALIGTGGSNLAGDIAATVVVSSAGGLVLNSANGAAGSFTQVGLGGLNADGVHTGTTTVNAVGGISLTGGATDHSYSQIGAGGVGSDGDKVNSSVSVRGASVSLTSGAGAAASTQIGSGGGATSAGGLPTGNVNGAVNVVTTTGGISLNGGGDRSFAQIGHGGGGRNGDFTGEIQIVSADGLGITGGTAARGYALVGHGGTADAGGFTTGLREGNVLVSAAGLTQLADGAATAFLGHRGAGGVTGASRLALVTGQLDTATNATGVTGMIANVIGVGTAEIGVTNGNLVVNGPAMNYNSANVVDLFASGDTTVLASLQNAGAGALNLVAGWDGTTGLTQTVNPAIFPPISALALDYSAVLADTAAYTNNGGVVSIGDGTQTTPIAVGSALGQTNLLGDGVALVSGSAAGNYAQVGFRGTSNALINGTINVGVGASGLSLQSSAQSGAFTQIGHGGSGAASAAVQADINLDFVNGGDLTITAGDANTAYAQIGHGGVSYVGSIIGDITASGTIGTLAITGGGAASQAAYAQIGHGGDAAVGAKNGNISLEAEEISVDAGDGFRSGAQIGHGGRGGVGTLAGGIDVTTTLGDLTVAAGGGNLASAQVGHGGLGYSGVVNDQSITLDVAGSLTAKGGTAIQASALIGHGGTSSSGGTLGGDVLVNVGNALEITGGSGLTAFAQIGHGGALVTANLSGDITVATGGDAGLAAPNSATSGAYAKIGHGDDMRGSFGAAAGTGTRTGNIEVAAGGSLTMNQALIGHTNSTSNATSAGTTQVGVSWLDPSDPTGGNLVADSTSEFSGDELRFYLPRRVNNQVAAGAKMNGVAYTGGLTDPYPTKGADEFANYVQTDSGTIQLAEHDSTFGSGPAPTVAGSYAFYFDTIVQGTPVAPPLPPEPPAPPVPPAPDYRDSILDDRVIDDWIREQEGLFSTPGSTSIFYEGYTQYGPNGESIYNFNNAAGMGSDEEEDVLRRQLQLLEEQAEQAEQAGQSAGTGETSQGAE